MLAAVAVVFGLEVQEQVVLVAVETVVVVLLQQIQVLAVVVETLTQMVAMVDRV
jgi:hypothetical protein